MNRLLRALAMPLVVALLPAAAGCGLGSSRMDEGTVAVVDGLPVTLAEVEERCARLTREMDGSPPRGTAQADALKRAVVRELVDRRLLAAEAARRGLTVTPEEVSSGRQLITGSIPAEDLRETLSSARMTPERLDAVVREDILITKLVALLEAAITVTDAELAEHYEKNKAAFFRQEAVRARQLVVPTEAEARQARKRIVAGEDFGAVAREVSQSLDASEGGDLGFFSRGDMPLQLEEAAFSLRPGQLSPIIETPYGFHLLKVEVHRPPGQLTLDEVRRELATKVRESKREDRYAALLEELGKKARIAYNRRHESILPEGTR